MKDKNSYMYIFTIITVVVVYFVIYLFGINIKKNIYLENTGYQNNLPTPPVNNIFSMHGGEGNKVTIFSFEEEHENYIDLRNQFPMSDFMGKALEGDKRTYDFKLKLRVGATNTKYKVTAIKSDESDLADDWVKIYLIADGTEVSNCLRDNGKVKTFDEYPNYLDDSKEKVLYEGVVTHNEVRRGYKNFTFKMWISEDVEVVNDTYLEQYFKAFIKIYAEKR